VEFDMFSKVNVNGSNALPLFKFLKNRLAGYFGNFVKWNFTKFLCDADGVPYKRYAPNTSPVDIVPDLEKLFK
jgi:glutathione peroxidase-family protein